MVNKIHKIEKPDIYLTIERDKLKRKFKLLSFRVEVTKNGRYLISAAEIEYNGRLGKKIKENIGRTICNYAQDTLDLKIEYK